MNLKFSTAIFITFVFFLSWMLASAILGMYVAKHPSHVSGFIGVFALLLSPIYAWAWAAALEWADSRAASSESQEKT